jgi:NAD/NADP transhydrogenase alpha subunit
MLVIQSPSFSTDTMLGELAILFASVNVFGGFVVTHRMLLMFVPRSDDEDDATQSKFQHLLKVATRRLTALLDSCKQTQSVGSRTKMV